MYGFGLSGDSQLGLGVKLNDGDDVLVDTPQMIGALQGKMISSVAGGSGMTVFLSESSGTVYTCGRQKNTGSGRSANESVLAPEPLDAAKFFYKGCKIARITAGSAHAFAISVNGEIFGWGSGDMYQLGNVPRNYKVHTQDEKDAEVGGDELTPYLIHSKQLDSRFVLGAAAGSQHSVLLAISVDEDLAQVDRQGVSEAAPEQNLGLKRGRAEEDDSVAENERSGTYSKPAGKNENLTGSGTKKLNNVFDNSARKSKEESNKSANNPFGGTVKPPVFPGFGDSSSSSGNPGGNPPNKLTSPEKYSEYRPGGDLASVSKISIGNRGRGSGDSGSMGSGERARKRVKRNPMAFAKDALLDAVDYAKTQLDVKMAEEEIDDQDILDL